MVHAEVVESLAHAHFVARLSAECERLIIMLDRLLLLTKALVNATEIAHDPSFAKLIASLPA